MTLGEPCGTDEFAAGTATGFLPWLLSPALKFSAYTVYSKRKPRPPGFGGVRISFGGPRPPGAPFDSSLTFTRSRLQVPVLSTRVLP